MNPTNIINYIVNTDVNTYPLTIVVYIPAYIDINNFVAAVQKSATSNVKIDYFLTLHFACRYIQLTALLKHCYLFIDNLNLYLKSYPKLIIKYHIINQNNLPAFLTILELRRHLFKLLKNQNQKHDIKYFKFDSYIFGRLHQVDQSLDFTSFIQQYCSDLFNLDQNNITISWQICEAEEQHKKWCALLR